VEGAFAHLAVRSSYSLRDGAIRPRELAVAAAAAGMTHVGLTDRDGLYGAVRFARACDREGVTPVVGADLALAPDLSRPGWAITRAGRERLPTGDVEDPRRRRPGEGPAWLEDDAARVTLLAEDGGYGDLCRAVSAAHRDARSSPHLAWKDATHHAGRLVALLGPDSPVGRLVADGRHDAAADEVARWAEAFGHGNVVLGVRHHVAAGDDRRAGAMVALADRLGLTAAAVNDVRYLRAREAYLADVLACVRGQVPIDDVHVGRTTAEGWFKTATDLARIPLFRDRPDLLRNTQAIAERCATDLELHTGPRAPHLTGLDDEEAARELRARCETGLGDRYPQVTAEVRRRLVDELTMIDRLGLHDYFLAVADIVATIREMRVICACRGSAAGSLVCYLLRISDVDPVGNGLLFERFMNPYRDELPDIDIDVESARREDVYRMIVDRYGEQRTACVAMVETFQARMGVREVGKVLGLPDGEIDLVAKAFRRVRARDVRTAVRELPELAGSRLDAGQLEILLRVVERIDGFPRHLALHPCGIVLADDDLLDRTPVERSANGFSMAQFDKDDVAALGLLKLDVLGVRMLSAARHALDLLPTTRGEDVDFEDIPREDPATYELLRTTESIGVFQVESPGQQELLGRLQPEHFGDLITEISLFRPGPVKADMVGPYVARRRGEEEPSYQHPLLEPVLGETYGVVVYHEQVMGVVAALTGCDLSHADLVRRELADPQRLPALRVWALTRARDRGFDRCAAEEIWAQVESFASFGFCKAHAAAFAVPTYRSAWLKRHRLAEFTAGLLTHDPGMFPRRLILHEARRNGIEVRGPDVNRSVEAYTVESGAIRIGLQDVRGMSATERERLIGGRPYRTIGDLRDRGGLSAPSAEALVRAGALDDLAGIAPPARRGLLLEVSEQWAGRGRHHPRGPEQTSLELDADHRPRLPEASLADVVRDELAVLGLDVARHVVSFYERILDVLGVVRAGDLHAPDAPADGDRIRVGGVRVALQSPPVRSGQRVLFLSLDDATGTVQCNFFARTLETEAWTVLNAWLVVVEGRLRRSGARGVTILADRAWDLSRLWRAWGAGGLAVELRRSGPPLPAERDGASPAGLSAAMFAQGSR
jgi:error-prone DNA polymerase